MRELTIKLYTLNELPRETRQEIIRDNYSLNISGMWWGKALRLCRQIGVVITEFELETGSCQLRFSKKPETVAEIILKEFGKHDPFYYAASEFNKDFQAKTLLVKLLGEKSAHGLMITKTMEHIDGLKHEFEIKLRRIFLAMLEDEHERLTSDKEIANEIISRGWEYTYDGKNMTLAFQGIINKLLEPELPF